LGILAAQLRLGKRLFFLVHPPRLPPSGLPKSEDGTANGAYPIFISWNSRLDSCWKDHMKVVKGKPVAMPWDMFTVGYYVFADVFLAIGQRRGHFCSLNKHLYTSSRGALAN
jgi:hypothetical protein